MGDGRMPDRPILFSTPMVRALLDGRKSQTRRIIRDAPSAPGWICYRAADDKRTWIGPNGYPSMPCIVRFAKGDRLWVRETWAHYHTVNHIRRSHGGAFDEVSDGLAGYRADGHDTIEDFRQHIRLMSGLDLEAVVINGDRWRPAIHMPRWASRLTLTVTDVRVERLQDISEADAIAEGAPSRPWEVAVGSDLPDGHRAGFYEIWTAINGDGAWARNDWVIALTFSVAHRNIDSAPMPEREERT